MKNSKKTLLAMAVTGALLQGGVVYAADATTDIPSFDLDQMVVTASRIEKKKVDTPANVAVVNAKEIERKNYKSVAEAIDKVPGVSVSNAGPGGGEQYIRIHGDDRVLVMIDGRLTNLDKGVSSGRGGLDAQTLPDPSIIERIEVIKGAGTAMYGSSAVGGVVNIITKKPGKDTLKVEAAIGNFDSYEYNGMVAGRRGKYGFMLYGGTHHQKDMKYKDAHSGDIETLKGSKWERDTFGVKLDREISDDQLLTIDYAHTFKDGGGTIGLNYLTPDAESTQLNNTISLRYDWNLNEDNAGHAIFYHSYYKGEYNDHMSYPTINEYTEKKNGIELQQNIKTSDTNNLVTGINYRKSNIESLNYDGEKDINNTSIFVNDNWNITEDWLLSAGVRYDKHNMFGHKFTGAAGINKKFGEDAHVYLNWAQVFNAPQGNDLFWEDAYMKGNPDLQAESGQVWTLGYDAKVSDSTEVGASIFYGKINDAINWTAGPGYIYTAENVDKQKRRGLELSVNHAFSPKWAANASYTYTKVDNDYGTGFIRDLNIVPNVFRFGVNYTVDKWTADLTAKAGTGASQSQYVDSSYMTFDASTTYQMTKNIKLWGKVNNILNKAYTERAGLFNGNTYRYPMPARWFMIGAEYSF